MKTLVHNFSSEISTEPMYITQALLNMGYDVALWGNEMSAFDAFDTHDPDIFITHAGIVNNDIIKRLQGTNIKCIVNVTGLDASVLPEVSKLSPNTFLYQNSNILQGVHVLQPCADIFLSTKKPAPQYEADILFLISDPSQLERINKFDTDGKVYHIIGASDQLNGFKEIDACLPLTSLPSIYNRYKERVACGISQMAYDAGFHGGSCGILSGPNVISMFLKKEALKGIATPYNRVSELFGMIGEDKVVEKAKEFIGSVE